MRKQNNVAGGRSESPIPEIDDHPALRAFLQRAETRLSIMHGVAGAFISGAGLLILLPVLFRDTFTNIISVFFDQMESGDVLKMPWVVIFFLSLYLSAYALWLLIKDIVMLYYTPHGKDAPRHFFPRFALAAISFPKDEPKGCADGVSKTKIRVMRSLHSTENINFVLPKAQEETSYLDRLGNEFPEIISRTRFQRQSPLFFGKFGARGRYRYQLLKRFNVSIGMSGVSDRSLVDEAARLEAALVRYNISLRIIVIRYTKALLLFLWLAMVLLALNQILGEKSRFVSANKEPILLWFFLIWASLSPYIVRRPVQWIWNIGDRNSAPDSIKSDPHLRKFERVVFMVCIASAGIATIESMLGFYDAERQIITFLMWRLMLLLGGIASIIFIFIYGRKIRHWGER